MGLDTSVGLYWGVQEPEVWAKRRRKSGYTTYCCLNGHTSGWGSSFCSKCGSKISKLEPPPPPDPYPDFLEGHRLCHIPIKPSNKATRFFGVRLGSVDPREIEVLPIQAVSAKQEQDVQDLLRALHYGSEFPAPGYFLLAEIS